MTKSEFERLGVVVDADDDAMKRWGEIRQSVSDYGFELPERPEPSGAIVTKEAQKIGIWLMPDNQNPGILEDLFRAFIPDKDALAPFVSQSLDTIETNGVARYKNRTKAFVHTWLAWQEDAGMPMGRAISDYGITDVAAAENFAGWLKQLFADE